ncbi:type I DNA topoisomerase [Pseudomonas aeruginosa]|uniref:type I DNA topoisomerase n=1 Tax=Pseudomonas aeruginosa TaxID=287 RepID=UPI0003BB34B6|nr:type I DNA topoisomerase [Pseudomonas aeruginosa]ERZ09684.1 DNA topoisomerase I [Pseudomonas aeruginosa S54485]RPO67814.1 DNA topoisomerase 1 [Pseudomonas aeruginosa]
MKLMVVESPNKTKKIEAELGSDWKVMASAGHIRDLPQKELGISKPDFALNYEYIPPVKRGDVTFPGGEQRVARIRKVLREADEVYLASDPDREGEAIAWHLKEALGLGHGDYQRITFDAITKKVIEAAIDNPRKIDDDRVQAQEARRALDRIVGYMVSPVLSDMLGMSVSAGRVQSVAVRVVVDNERRIKAFKKTNHFGAVVWFDSETWSAEWDTKPFTTPESPYVLDEELANRASNCRQFRVTESSTDMASEAPPPPFSTSLMLQAASVSLKLNTAATNKAAQRLFEQGAITYIRTDSVNFEADAIAEMRAFAEGKGWKLPDKPRRFKAKGDAQEAHEAIRPTHMDVEEAGEDKDQKALYRLIWQRAMASQLADARYKVNSVTLESTDSPQPFVFRAKGRVMVEPGWRVLTAKDAIEDEDDADDTSDAGKVPVLDVGSDKRADTGKMLRKQTQPPKRYTEATLIKKLEAEGVGRPSTYGAIMTNVLGRAYLTVEKRYLVPTEIGELVVDNLVKAGFSFMDLGFTRAMEDQLDQIAEGKLTYLDVVAPAYNQLAEELVRIAQHGEFKPRFTCPKCQQGLRRHNHPARGPFWCCTNDECRHFMDDDKGKPVERQSHPCPKCGTALRRYKRKQGSGHVWVCPADACETFLDDLNGKPLAAHSCPKCSSPLRRYQKKDRETGKPKGGYGWFCTNDECKTFMDDEKGKPLVIKTAVCPSCGKTMYRRKSTSGGGYWWGCSGFKDGCKTIMDDDKGKPVPRKAGGKSGSKTASSMPSKLVLKPARKK